MTKQQKEALDAAVNAEAAERERLESKVQQEAAERAVKVAAWEDDGLSWLKAGEGLFGPNYEFQGELNRLGMRYTESRILPYEGLSDFGIKVYAGVRAIFLHGLIAVVLSLIAVDSGVPLWFELLASGAYVIWYFRVRKTWLLTQRADSHALRAEIAEARSLRALPGCLGTGSALRETVDAD